MIGAMPQKVGERAAYKDIKIYPEFETSGFSIETIDNAVSLTIPRIKREDGGLYFCGILSWVNFMLSNGTFLAVTGNELNLFCTIWLLQKCLQKFVHPICALGLKSKERKSKECRYWILPLILLKKGTMEMVHYKKVQLVEIGCKNLLNIARYFPHSFLEIFPNYFFWIDR